MKFSIAAIATLAAAASAQYQGQPQPASQQQPQQYQAQVQQQPWVYSSPVQNKYSPAEAQAWHSCMDRLLDQFNSGHSGSSVSCSTFRCLEQTANQYSRGGVLAGLGNVVSLACGFGNVIPVSDLLISPPTGT